MKIKVNDEEREVAENSTLAEIVVDIPQTGTATAINGKFIPKDARNSKILKEGDEVTIISAAYGG